MGLGRSGSRLAVIINLVDWRAVEAAARKRNMKPPTPSVSVIICATAEQSWESLCLTVRSVHRQSRPPSEIILVIDNNRPLLQRAMNAFPGMRVMPNSDVRGMAGARHCGLRAARGRLIAFVEGAAVASPN